MTNLKDINFGINQYCGPAVLSALTGRNTDACAAVISAVSGAREIKGVQVAHLLEAFRRLRFDVTKIQDCVAYTLYGTLTQLANKPGSYIILIPGHFIAVEIAGSQIYLIDNHTKQAINAAASARLGQRVINIYKVTELPQPKWLRDEIRINEINQTAYIECVSRHENPTDDMVVKLGHIRFRSVAERSSVINALINSYLID